MGVPTIIADRLIIREYTQQDLMYRHELIERAFNITCSIQSIEQWLDWTLSAYRGLERLHQPPYGDNLIEIKETHQPIGSIGFVPTMIPWKVFESTIEPTLVDRVSAEMGLFWAIQPNLWGRGYATEAAHAFVRYAFDVLKLNQIVATTEHDNLRSQRVMAKLGMKVLSNPTTEPFWFEVVGVLHYVDWRSLSPKSE